MNDLVINAVHSGLLSSGNISFDNIKKIAGRDRRLWSSLGHGREILDSPEKLDQYLYSYGPMTRDQWHTLLGSLELISEPMELIDYGCGQGLATALLFDYFGSEFIKTIRRVVLIEPSNSALKRAEAIVKCYSSGRFRVEAVEKKLNDLVVDDLIGDRNILSTHIFSNILDIDSYDHLKLLKKVFQRDGRHCILAVSHDRNFEGGSSRFHDLEDAVCSSEFNNLITIQQTQIWQFICRSGMPAIAWALEVEVLNGVS